MGNCFESDQSATRVAEEKAIRAAMKKSSLGAPIALLELRGRVLAHRSGTFTKPEMDQIQSQIAQAISLLTRESPKNNSVNSGRRRKG